MFKDIVNKWTGNSQASNSVIISTPDTINRQSVLVCVLIKTGNSAALTNPSGWVLVESSAILTSGYFEVWKKQATLSEPSSFTWTGDTQDYIATIYEIFLADFNTIEVPFLNAGTGLIPSIPKQDATNRKGFSQRIVGYGSVGDAGVKSLESGHNELFSLQSGNLSFISGESFHHSKSWEYQNKITKPFDMGQGYFEIFGDSVAISADGLHLLVGSGYKYWYESLGAYSNIGRIYSYKRDTITSVWSTQGVSDTLEGHPTENLQCYMNRRLVMSKDALILMCITYLSTRSISTYTRATPTSNWVHQHIQDILIETNFEMSDNGLIILSAKKTYSRASINLDFTLQHTNDFAGGQLINEDGLSGFIWLNRQFIAANTQDLRWALHKNTVSGNILLSYKNISNREPVEEHITPALIIDNGHTVLHRWNINGTFGYALHISTIARYGIYDALPFNPLFTSPDFVDAEDRHVPYSITAISSQRGNPVSMHGKARSPTTDDYHLCSFLPYMPLIEHSASLSVDWLSFYIDYDEIEITGTEQIATPQAALTEVAKNPPYVKPIAVSDTYETEENQELIVSAIDGVFKNDVYVP